MKVNKMQEKIKYELGDAYDPNANYTLSTPNGVPSHLAKGLVKLGSFEAHLGEKLVIMGEPPVAAGKRG